MFSFINNMFGTPAEDIKTMLAKGAIIIDVRQPNEFQSGHIEGATNIPLSSIAANISKIKDLNKPVVAYCASGNRSGMATRQLEAQGIEVINGGGFGAMQRIIAEV